MGGSSGTTTVQKADPWAGQQPYLESGFAAAKNNYNSGGPQYYNGSTVAGQSADTTNAYDMMRNQVTKNPLQSASSNQVQNTLNGSYLNSNPYLDANFQAGSDSITKAYNAAVNGQTSGFAGGGRMGSGMQAFYQNDANDTLAKNLGNLYSNTYYNNYNTERQNQVGAVNQAGTVQNQGITNASNLGTVGSAQDQYSQSLTDANVNKWNYNQNLPYNNLAQYLGLINGSYGQSSSTTTPLSGQSLLGNLLGGASLGLGAYSALK